MRNDHHLGIAASKNLAIDLSTGEYIALMDASDISLSDRLRSQVTFLENNTEIMILGTAFLSIDRDGNLTGSAAVMPGSSKHYQAKMLMENPEFCYSSAIIRKAFLKEHNLTYRDDDHGLHDYRFFMESSKFGAISCLADIHYRHRVQDIGINAGSGLKFTKERAQIYNRIRCDSLSLSGVNLSNNDRSTLGRLLPESGLPIWNRREREKLAKLFAKIRKQLVSNGFSAISELDEILLSTLNH